MLLGFSFDLRGGVGRQFRLDGGDFLADGSQQAASVRGVGWVFLRGARILALAFVRLHEGLSALGFDELHADLRRHCGGRLLVGFPDAVGEGGDAALLEVLVHEGVHDGVVEAVEEADGLDDGDDGVDRDAVVFVLQIIWNRREHSTPFEEHLGLSSNPSPAVPVGCLQYSKSMWTVWNGAQQMVNSRTMVTIILTALFFFL